MTVRLEKSTNMKEIHAAFEEASKGSMKGVLGITHDEVVSTDFIHDSRSSIVDAEGFILIFFLISFYFAFYLIIKNK